MRRAYGSEPILLDTSPVSKPVSPRKKPRLSHWMKVAVAAGIGVSLMGLALWLVFGRAVSEPIIPLTIRKTVTFPLLEPRSLPPGFAVDANSFQSSASVLTFAITYDNGKTLIVSEQSVPPAFDFDAFYEQFENRKNVTAGAVQAVIGRFEEADLASIVRGSTWVLIRAPYGVDAAALEAVVQQFGQSS